MLFVDLHSSLKLLIRYDNCIEPHKIVTNQLLKLNLWSNPGGVRPYKGLMGTCGQPGYVFRDFCLEQGIEFIIFCLNQGIDLSIFVLNWVGRAAPPHLGIYRVPPPPGGVIWFNMPISYSICLLIYTVQV